MAARRWTLEQRKRQAERIRQWQPWRQSTGPKSPEGRMAVAQNSWRGGRREKWRELARELRELCQFTLRG